MKRIFTLILCLCTILSLVACSGNMESSTAPAVTAETKEAVKETNPQPTPSKKTQYPEVTDKLTWDRIKAIPVATDDMTEEQLRNVVLQYFELAQTFAWTPDRAYQYVITTSDKSVTLPSKQIYGGMPYVTNGLGNVYRWMDFYDAETGVMYLSKTASPKQIGNQCSYGTFWAWSRVSNSLEYFYTNSMTLVNGCIPVGPYKYDTSKVKFSKDDQTGAVCSANGEQVMFQSYGMMKPADGMVHYSTAGHVIMCSSTPVIVYNADGTINGDESYTTYMDQGSKWREMEQSDGTKYNVQGGVHRKVTFTSLFNDGYIPFTLKEFLGTDPVEKAEASLNIELGESVTANQLRDASVITNYTVSHVIVTVTDADGKEVYKYTGYADLGKEMVASFEYDLSKAVFPASLSAYANKGNTITVKVWVGSGECLEVCSATLDK
ncbi:MAG: hypothetical protein E7580_06800 [Ruminococcaceae bacterium]|nr:hypothetical protein [Oscillospiraceae bacterium]